jgi:translation elongation factor EF-Ts
MCSFLSFIFLQSLQAMVDKLVASHESEKMMPKITNIVEYGLIDVESSSQRAIDELKVSFKENMTEDQETNNFLTIMEQIINGDHLKDFSDQVLRNQVSSEEDEKEIMSMKDESSPFNQSQLVEILETVE